MSEITPNVAALPVSETSEMAKPDTITRPVPGYRAIWNRAILLFGALCVIKLVMLFELRKHLFEVHWRWAPMPVTWVNHLAFYVFAVLVGLNLWVFAIRCERSGVRAVRGANAWVLVLSSLFILLTFSESGQDYVGAIMNAYLDVKDLRWFLEMNFCFRWPFLTLWVLGYGLVYYGLYRKDREYLALRVTAVCAAVYVASALREFIYVGEILIVVDCLGLASFLGAWKAKRRLNLLIPVVLLAWMASFFVLFFNYDNYLTWGGMNREFIVLSACSLVLFAGVTVAGWYRGFFTAWSWLLPFAFATFLLLINVNYVPAANYFNFICAGLTLPRYFLGELVVVLLWFGLAWIYRRVWPRGPVLWLDVLSLVLIAIGLIDLGLTRIMSVRLDWQVLSLAFGETPKMMWRMSRPYLPAVALALAVIAGIYAGLLATMRRASAAGNAARRDDSGCAGTPPSRFADAKWLLLGFILLGFSGVYVMDNDKGRGQTLTVLARTSPLWEHAANPVMDGKQFDQTARELRIWQSPEKAVTRSGWQPADHNLPAASGSARDMNVVVIFQESTYNQFLSLFNGTNDTEPLLSKYKDRLELFPNFYSSFAASINARFATFTGLYPVGDFNAFTTRHVPVKSLFEVLHDNGYSNSLFYSSYFDYTGFRDFLRGRGIDEMYDADTMPGGSVKAVSWGLREDDTLGAITNQIKKYAAAKQKFCLTYVPAAPHNPFDGTPDRFKKFPHGQFGDFTPQYLNELLFMDWVVTSIVDQLKESGLLDNTLVLITGDHGEMLGENGGPIGHGWLWTPQLGNVPLILMNPKRHGYRVNDTIGSQVDVLPTVLDLLGIPLPTDQLYQGVSLYSADAARDRTIYLNTFQQYGVIESDLLFCGNRGQKARVEGPLGFFSFTNNAARTVFQYLDHAPAGATNSIPSISEFDHFQANFLHNYSDYCRIAQQSAAGK